MSRAKSQVLLQWAPAAAPVSPRSRQPRVKSGRRHDAEPGAVYRYRCAVVINNPNVRAQPPQAQWPRATLLIGAWSAGAS